ncbi:unnamed protein product [Echinostoma caproni]|uniref:Uncharacterized protein n=1 Tax=Echinostoma caproni TaxID=27848 RepID=A0A183B3V0_9TREM|nr:unnamed protein product [Echinostoma caproni]
MGDMEVSISSVLDVMEGLNVNKSAGSDGLHPAIMKPLASVLALAMTTLYQESLRAGRVPSDLATATVVDIHKSGDRKQPGATIVTIVEPPGSRSTVGITSSQVQGAGRPLAEA